jgi:hypothetical protein
VTINQQKIKELVAEAKMLLSEDWDEEHTKTTFTSESTEHVVTEKTKEDEFGWRRKIVVNGSVVNQLSRHYDLEYCEHRNKYLSNAHTEVSIYNMDFMSDPSPENKDFETEKIADILIIPAAIEFIEIHDCFPGMTKIHFDNGAAYWIKSVAFHNFYTLEAEKEEV